MILTYIYVFTIYRRTLNPKCQTLNPTTLNPRRYFKIVFHGWTWFLAVWCASFLMQITCAESSKVCHLPWESSKAVCCHWELGFSSIPQRKNGCSKSLHTKVFLTQNCTIQHHHFTSLANYATCQQQTCWLIIMDFNIFAGIYKFVRF